MDDTHTGQPERWSINPVGIGIALLGALAMIIAIFLPRVESSAFSLGGIQENTLVQSGDGLIFVGLAVGICGAVYRSWKQGVRSWAVIVLALIAIGVAYYDGTNEDSLTLYRIDAQGTPDYSNSEKATPGVGIWLAGVGGALALLGGWQIRREATLVPAGAPAATSGPDATKRCPECAETVLAAARVCKHCGYRFEPTAPVVEGTD